MKRKLKTIRKRPEWERHMVALLAKIQTMPAAWWMDDPACVNATAFLEKVNGQ